MVRERLQGIYPGIPDLPCNSPPCKTYLKGKIGDFFFKCYCDSKNIRNGQQAMGKREAFVSVVS